MAFALIVLAVGSVLAGYVGLPASLGGSDRLARYLAPSFTAAAVRAPGTVPGEAAGGDARQGDASAEGLELGLMGVSSAAALGGIGLAFFFFLKNKRAADDVAKRFRGLHRVLLNKYYVDEIYDAGVVQPIRIVSDEGLWKIVDVGIIDRAVNGVGELVGGSSEVIRRLQTGSVRAYAASLFFGVVAILGYYLWR
jgi:NADH-quinone oxidoreductase subunit L